MPSLAPSAGRHLELELKLEFEPEWRTALIAHPLLASLDRRSNRQVSTYFDTADRRLRKAGYVVRIRRQGRHISQTIKADVPASGLFARPEWQRELVKNSPLPKVDGSPLAVVLGEDGAPSLVPIFETDVKRTSGNLRSAGATVCYSIDDGYVRAGQAEEEICELELERVAGDITALFDIARELNQAVPLRLGVLSKAERGYALCGPVESGNAPDEFRMTAETGAADAFRLIVQACIRQFRLNEASLVKTGNVEAVHEARVALRRLRTAFTLFKPLLGADPRTSYFKQEFRRLAALLGKVRSLDVLIPVIASAERSGLTAARTRALSRAKAELSSVRTRRLMIDLVEWLAIGDWRLHPSGVWGLETGILPFACEALNRRRKRLKRLGREMDGLSKAELHRLRMETKKLRYALQFFAAVFPKKKQRKRCRALYARLGRLQESLGQLNDVAAARRSSLRLAPDAPPAFRHRRSRVRIRRRAERQFAAIVEAKPFWAG